MEFGVRLTGTFFLSPSKGGIDGGCTGFIAGVHSQPPLQHEVRLGILAGLLMQARGSSMLST